MRVQVVDDDKFWGPRNLDDNVMRVRAPWDEMQMLMLLKCPPKATTVLGNIHVHNGRPNWDEHFETVATRHAANDIGVAYCGNPFIAKDLRLQCARYSSINSKTFFRLHKVIPAPSPRREPGLTLLANVRKISDRTVLDA